MIQVCSQCGTRWNVRDRERVWCPRCHGTLLPPSGPPASEWSQQQSGSSLRPSGLGTPPTGAGRTPPRLSHGYRWIAVRPGAPPSNRRRRGPLGPTPRYALIPRWGLVEHFDAGEQQQGAPRLGPSVAMVRRTLLTTMVVLGVAALLHVVRYALLLLNRNRLLNPWVAGAVTWLGVAASVVAMFAVVASVLVLMNWLIGRRAAAFAHRGQHDPRPSWELRLGSLLPVINLAWAPIFVMELAATEERLTRLRRPIVVWWVVWVFSTLVSIFSIATSFTADPQGIANNTVTTTIAYLLALAALLLATQVFLGFERTPVERPVKRWVIVGDERPNAAAAPQSDPDREAESAAAVETEGQNPAA